MLLNDIDMNDAKMKELESWRENKVYHEVPHRNQKCVLTRWVYSFKRVNNSLIPKARLVARSCEEYSQDIQKDSPTCAHESLRLIISVLAQNKWIPPLFALRTWSFESVPIVQRFLNLS